MVRLSFSQDIGQRATAEADPPLCCLGPGAPHIVKELRVLISRIAGNRQSPGFQNLLNLRKDTRANAGYSLGLFRTLNPFGKQLQGGHNFVDSKGIPLLSLLHVELLHLLKLFSQNAIQVLPTLA